MVQFTTDEKLNREINQQLDYHVSKYKSHMNETVLRARAELIVRKALKDWNPSKGNIKTYLNGQLQQLYRFVNSNQTVYIPENQLQTMHKAKKIIHDYRDTYGRDPSPEDLAKELKITEKKAKNMIYMVDGTTRTSFETEDGGHVTQTFSDNDVIGSIQDPIHKQIAHELYTKGTSPKIIQQKFGIGQTKFYEMKKNIDNHINQFAEHQYTLEE